MVLSALPVGEYDKRIVLLTKERGKISGFANGCPGDRTSPMMAAANPFCYGTFECFEGRSSYNIYQAQIDQYFEKLSLDFENAYYGMYFLEFADYYARENNDEKELLKLLYVTLKALEHGRVNRKLIRYIYEMRAMVINGEYPESFSCVNCGSSEGLMGYSDEKNGVICQNWFSTYAWKTAYGVYDLCHAVCDGSPTGKTIYFSVDTGSRKGVLLHAGAVPQKAD